MPIRIAWPGLAREMSLPAKRTRPVRMGRRPASMQAISLLPAPMRPVMPRISPGDTEKDTSCTFSPSPAPSTSRIGAAAAAAGGRRS